MQSRDGLEIGSPIDSPIKGYSDKKITPEGRADVDRQGKKINEVLARETAEAVRMFDVLRAQHPSMNDSFWRELRSAIGSAITQHAEVDHARYLAKQQGGTVLDRARVAERIAIDTVHRLIGKTPTTRAAEETAKEIRVFGFLESLIEQSIVVQPESDRLEKNGELRRIQSIRKMIIDCEQSLVGDRSNMRDVVSRREEMWFLRRALGDTSKTLDVLVDFYTVRLGWGLSPDREKELQDRKEFLEQQLSFIRAEIEEARRKAEEESKLKEPSVSVLEPAEPIQKQLKPKIRGVRLAQPAEISPDDEPTPRPRKPEPLKIALADRSDDGVVREQEPHIQHIVSSDLFTQMERDRRRAESTYSNVSISELCDLRDALVAIEEDELDSVALEFERPVNTLRGPLNDARIAEFDRLFQEHLPESGVDALRRLLNVKIRLEVTEKLLREQPDRSPEEILGLRAEDVSRSAVERAFASAMQSLDFDVARDRKEIGSLQRARETLLQRVEKDERRILPKEGAISELPRKVEVPESWFSRTLRSPGARVRALFAGAVGLGAIGGAVALHEFGETESEPSHIVVGALENTAIEDTGGDTSASENEVAEAAVQKPSSDFVPQKGDTLWRELKRRIQERGMRATDEKMFMLKHLADQENPGVDWNHLEIGTSVRLGTVDSMLDEMEGKPVPKTSGIEAQKSVSVSASEQLRSDSRLTIDASSNVLPAIETPLITTEKAYSDLPRVGHTEHVLAKGEWIYKIIHLMLREQGLNWNASRIARLKNMTLEENGLTEEQAARIPVGKVLTFTAAVEEIQGMKAAKEKGKK